MVAVERGNEKKGSGMRMPAKSAKPMRWMLAGVLVSIFSVGAQAQEGFRSPSGNIHCMLEDRSTLRCDLLEFNSAPPPKPASCDGDWGQAFVITHDGQSGQRICYSDTVVNDQWPVLAYGSSWQGPGFACQSDVDGMTCVNTHRHGFILSRGSQKLF